MLISTAREDCCVGFVNTRSWRGSPAPQDSLLDFSALVDWLGGEGGLDRDTIADWRAWGSTHPARSDRLLTGAVELRESLKRLFAAIAAGEPAPAQDLAALNGAIGAAPKRTGLAVLRDGFGWTAESSARGLPALLAPVLWSAGDLLAGPRRDRLRRCANEKCLWLFVDESKSGTRRWCDMSSCGNRAKAQRHYRKKMSA